MQRDLVTQGTDVDDELRQFPELTALEERFAYAYVANEGKLKAAAITAGYAKTSAHVTASRLIRKTAVLRAIQQISISALGALTPQAIGRIAKLGLKAKSEHVQLEASKDILDRNGLMAPKQIRVGATLNVSFDLA